MCVTTEGDGVSVRALCCNTGARAFGILEETIRQGQTDGEVRSGDSVLLARLVWAQVHGIGMLRLAEDLTPSGDGTKFVDFSSEVLQSVLRIGISKRPDRV